MVSEKEPTQEPVSFVLRIYLPPATRELGSFLVLLLGDCAQDVQLVSHVQAMVPAARAFLFFAAPCPLTVTAEATVSHSHSH